MDPWFVVEAVPQLARLISLSRKTNDSMPNHVVNRVAQLVPDQEEKIAVFGQAFKGNVDDLRESPAIEVAEGLAALGYRLGFYDPHIKQYKGQAVNDVRSAVHEADLIVVLTDHHEFSALLPSELLDLVKSPLVLDTRACLKRADWESAGFEYHLLGDGKHLLRTSIAAEEAAAARG